jgi:hypothetical protein
VRGEERRGEGIEEKSLRHKEEENGRLKRPVSGMLKAAVVGECLGRLFCGFDGGAGVWYSGRIWNLISFAWSPLLSMG